MYDVNEIIDELKSVGYYIEQECDQWFFITNRKTKSGFYQSVEQCVKEAYDNAVRHGVFE
jgi:hypothetical protein